MFGQVALLFSLVSCHMAGTLLAVSLQACLEVEVDPFLEEEGDLGDHLEAEEEGEDHPYLAVVAEEVVLPSLVEVEVVEDHPYLEVVVEEVVLPFQVEVEVVEDHLQAWEVEEVHHLPSALNQEQLVIHPFYLDLHRVSGPLHSDS